MIRLSKEIEADGGVFLEPHVHIGSKGSPQKTNGGHIVLSNRRLNASKVKAFLSSNGNLNRLRWVGICRLLLAAYEGHYMVYVGGVGTGFGEPKGRGLRKELEFIKTSKPAVLISGKGYFRSSDPDRGY
jgi:bifunctional non-homologous end joining protein LigD